MSRLLAWCRSALAFAETALPAVLYVVLVALVCTDVIGRYVFDSPLTGTSEWTAVAVVWIVLIGMARAAAVRAHVGISILTDRVPDPWRHRAERSVDVLTGLICFFAASASWHLVDATRSRVLPLTDFPVFWVNIAAPIGFVLTGLHFLLEPERDRFALDHDEAPQPSETNTGSSS